MKAMSIRQPWVHAILEQGKDVENRSWKQGFRGYIALHASGKLQDRPVFPRGTKTPDLSKLPLGAICGIARVVDIVTKSRSKWFTKPTRAYPNFGWVLTDVKRLKKPIPCKGMLGLWEVPPGVLRSMKRQLPARFLVMDPPGFG
jgi:hypothetical protein